MCRAKTQISVDVYSGLPVSSLSIQQIRTIFFSCHWTVKTDQIRWLLLKANPCLAGAHIVCLDLRKPVFGVSDQVRHKPGCTATENG